ncbi:MAG: hypothetical protein U0531_17010 [Dehalococcoidia bacterium]
MVIDGAVASCVPYEEALAGSQRTFHPAAHRRGRDRAALLHLRHHRLSEDGGALRLGIGHQILVASGST